MKQPHPKQLSEAELMAELTAAGAKFRGKKMHCLFPENHRNGDKNPSAGTYRGKDGVFRWSCHSCNAIGDIFDVQALRTGRPLKDIIKENAQDAPRMTNTPPPAPKDEVLTFANLEACYAYLGKKSGGCLEHLHEYHRPDGSHNQYVIKWRIEPGKKAIRPLVKTAAGYEMRFPDKRVLYRLPILKDAKTVVVTEGEAKADILMDYGFSATTSAGGCKQAEYTDWSPLAGKNCIIWPDFDTPGKGYAEAGKRILEGLGCRVKVIDPSELDLAESEDVVDYVQRLKNAGFDDLQIKDNILQVFKTKTIDTGPAAELDGFINDVIEGRIKQYDTGLKIVDSIIQITPETLTLLCGSPGAAKSLFVLQLIAYWISLNIKVACFMLERNRAFHLARALAQRAGVSQLTRIKWIESNPELAREAMAEHRDHIDRLGRSVWVDPDKSISQKDVIAWAKLRAESGNQILIIDPITLSTRTGDVWAADEALIGELKAIAATHKCAIMVVIHPAKGQIAMPDLSSIAGGAVYGRACDSALWLEYHKEPKRSMVAIADGYSATKEIQHNRTMIILKSRDGAGMGAGIACDLSTDNLLLSEIGYILKQKKGNQNEHHNE